MIIAGVSVCLPGSHHKWERSRVCVRRSRLVLSTWSCSLHGFVCGRVWHYASLYCCGADPNARNLFSLNRCDMTVVAVGLILWVLG